MFAWAEFAFFLLALTAVTPLLGRYVARIYEDADFPIRRWGAPVEQAFYRVCRVDAGREMSAKDYFLAAVAFSAISAGALFLLLAMQAWLPLNPQHFANVDPLTAFNVAVSFMTTTDWQPYAGESSLSYFSQMAGLAWQNFTAAAVGLAVAMATIRGFIRSRCATLGNFWVDLTRSIAYILLPLSIAGALLLVAAGTPQNFHAYTTVRTLEGGAQTITGGPIASQELIKQLGVNGGGFVAANSAAPNENPNPLTDFAQLVAMFLLGAALTNAFGRLTGDRRQGWMLYGVMTVLFAAGFAGVWAPEHAGNPFIHQLGIAGPNLEGKELRFGDTASALSVTVATDTSSGAANVAYDSLMPVSVFVALVNMQIGEIIFGGAGSGLYGMLLVVVLTVFIAGLMVGRTPEYLGKKIERREITLVMIAALVPAIIMLVPAAIALAPGVSSPGNAGPRGFSEILYAFTSVAANNGSALGGLTIATSTYDWLTAAGMAAGRFVTLAVTLGVAGSLANKARNHSVTTGTLDTASPLFGALVLATALVVTALTFIPADALGPVAEHLLMRAGRTF